MITLAVLAVSGTVFYIIHSGTGAGSSKDKKNLEIRDSVSRKVYGIWSLGESGEFAIEFIHSVNNSPVREIFKSENRMIRPLAVRFSSFGAGMLSDLEEGQKLSRDGDALVISGFNTSFKELKLIVGTVSDHLLFINNEIISMRDLCGRNAHITIMIK